MKTLSDSIAGSSGDENRPLEDDLEKRVKPRKSSISRRSFLGKSLAVGAGTIGVGLLPSIRTARASGTLTEGDAAILRFLAAAEILESDLWEQYWELGGLAFGEHVDIPRGESPPHFSGGNAPYTAALQILDGDMPQYISDNTDDEFSHQAFIRAFLASKGAST